MAQYFVDTNDWGSSIPAAWSVLQGADVWSMEVDSQDAGRMALHATVLSDGNHILAWASGDSGIDCSQAVELHCTFRVLSYSNGGTLMCGPVSDAVVDGAQYGFFGAGGFWHSSSGPNYRVSSSVRRTSDGSQSNDFGSTIFSTVQPASTVFHVRILCEADPGDDSGRTIHTKLWKEGDAEPGSYQLSHVVSTGWSWGHVDGEVGFLAVRDETFEFLTLGVGTDGDAAPTEEPAVPDTPTVEVDAVEEEGASFSTSPYSHPEGTGHQSTEWEVSEEEDFSTTTVSVSSTTELEAYTTEDLDPGVPYWVRARHVATDGGTSNWADAKSFTTTSCGDTPTARAGEVGTDSLTASVDALSEYLAVRYRLLLAGVLQEEVEKTGSGRFTHAFTGLASGTTYHVQALVQRDCGLSAWSTELEVTTLDSVPGADGVLGCPPEPQGWYWNPDSNPPNYETWRGLGWYTPYPGQPLSGTVECILRWPSSHTWDVEISDDLGQTYSSLASSVTNGDGELDGDQLQTHAFSLDTTGLTDGADYRLRATSQEDGTVVESLSFVVDNAGVYSQHDNRQGENDGSWSKLWGTAKLGDPLGNPDREFPLTSTWYYNNRDGALFSPRGTPWTCLADLDAGLGYGGDVTATFHLWTGEGGRFNLQGMLDCEAWGAGVALFANGKGEELSGGAAVENQTGIFIGLRNLLAYGYGCCDDLYTSTVARLTILGRQDVANAWDGFPVEGEAFNSADVLTLDKLFHRCAYNVPRYPGGSVTDADFDNNFMRMRLGGSPGSNLQLVETCGRAYSMYTVRAKVEVDPADLSRVHVRARVDGPGVQEPASGYWHFDHWITTDADWSKGYVGLASQQTVNPTYGNPEGVRVFTKWAGTTFDTEPVEEEEEELEVGNLPPQEGAPCTLVLEVYEEDRETVAWEVGTDRGHANPYLMEPEHYGEQEIDIIDGAATIAQVQVAVVDKPQTAGDQDSGWMTQRLADGGVGVIHGRRCRLIRYVSPEIGWVVIADGPAGTPRLDKSFAAYQWTIRDTRETERKVKAFTRLTQTTWLMPQGYPDGWGQYTDEAGQEAWLADPREPLVGTFETLASGRGAVNLIDDATYWPAIAGSDAWEAAEPVVIPSGPADALFADQEITEPPLTFEVHWTWPDLEVWWRAAGTEDDWTVVQVEETWDGDPSTDPGVLPGQSEYARELVQIQGREGGAPVVLDGSGNITKHIPVYLEGTRTPVLAASRILLRGLQQPASAGDLPAEGQEIEVAVRYKGEATSWAPVLVQLNEDGTEKTIGQFLQELYDGEYSPLRTVELSAPLIGTTTEVVPTGIHYDPDALAAMTEPVGPLLIREETDDLREWTEKHVYGPSGWVPALDNDMRISPVSQVPPADFSTAPVLDDPVTEPIPGWDAGETLVNILEYAYRRYYAAAVGRSPNLAWIEERDVEIVYRSDSAITNHGEHKESMQTLLHAAIGTQEGKPTRTLEDEAGWQQAELRKLYVFDRYENGAQAVHVPVRRSATSTLRPGDWVTMDLSWIPDYLTQRRGGVFGGQILAIRDVDCAWRVLLVEEALPVEVS